jgi:glycosyltransferase involved in cell wall biosynthesis
LSLRARGLRPGEQHARVVIAALDCSSALQLERLRVLAAKSTGAVFAVVEANDREWADLQTREREANFPNLTIERLGGGQKLGRGAAIRYGIKCVRAAIIAIVNIDEEISAESLEACFIRLESESELDAVFTYRRRSEGRSPEARLRRLESACFNGAVRALFALDVRDVQSPIKVFRHAAMERVFESLRLYNHGFDADVLINVERLGLRYVEIETPWTPQYREWDVLRIALGALVALLHLRLLTSPFGALPEIQLLGRHFWLPVKHHYRILLFCWRDPKSPNAGGGEVYLFEQARAWVRLGHDVTWFAQSFRDLPRDEAIDGVKVVRRGRSLFVFPRALLWYVFESGKKFDFLIDTMNGMPFFTPVFSLKPKVCLLFHRHTKHFLEELPRPLGRLAAWVETSVVPFVYRRTRFITISKTSLDEMKHSRMSRLPIGVVHGGVSGDFAPTVKSAVPTIVYVGRLRRYKQVRKLIDAFREVRVSVPDLQLIIGGVGDDAAALRLYASGDSAIRFSGRIDEAEKRKLMGEAWVFGMPSALEGWGITVIEAAACGTPTAAFNVSALRDSVVHGQTGLLAADDAEFAENLRRIVVDRNLRERLSKNAVTWAAQFSWNRAATRMLDEIRLGQPWRAVLEVEPDGHVSMFDDRQLPPSESLEPSKAFFSAAL